MTPSFGQENKMTHNDVLYLINDIQGPAWDNEGLS